MPYVDGFSAHATAEPASPGGIGGTARFDPDSETWIENLRPTSPNYASAVEDLHALLLKAARFEVRRRRASYPDAARAEGLAREAAADALIAVLRELGEFRGQSRFTTWACKFALLDAAAKTRRRVWRGRGVSFQATRELPGELQTAIQRDLSPHERRVLVATALNEVPIDVLAERLGKTRGALYKTIHDARKKLRMGLTERGSGVGEYTESASR